MSQQKPFPLRMPDELRSQLEQQAKSNNKSLNAEIVSRLSHSFIEIGEDQAKANAYELKSLKEKLARVRDALEKDYDYN